MEAPSDAHGPEAYLPPELGVDGDDEWPPAGREAAIEQARQARLEEGGLPIDDATLERVADAVMDPEYPVPGLHYTAEELADDELMDEGFTVPWGSIHATDERLADDRDNGPFGGVDAYLGAHSEINGGTRLAWRNGRRTLVIGLVGDAEAHKTRLLEIGGERVAFENVPRTVRELEALADRIVDERAQLEEAGFGLIEVGSDPPRGVVHVELVGGRDAAACMDYFAGRYGDAVAVVWRGPTRHREVPQPFGSWTSDGRLLRVFFALDYNGQRRGEARVTEESRERIVVELSRLEPVGYTTAIGGFQPHHADLELREAVGTRVVIDASAGVIRPPLARLRNR